MEERIIADDRLQLNREIARRMKTNFSYIAEHTVVQGVLSVSHTPTRPPGNRHHVVIIGSGFGGIFAAKELADADVDVTLIDRSNRCSTR